MLSKVESVFVNQTKNVVLIFTILALIITAGIGIYIGILFVSPSLDSGQSQSSSLSEYQKALDLNHKAKYEKKPKVEVEKIGDPLSGLIAEITENINKFASIVGEDPVDGARFKQALIDDITQRLGLKSVSDQKSILEELERETRKLESLGAAQHELPVTDERRIYTRDFYEWFINAKEQQIAAAELTAKAERELFKENKALAETLIAALPVLAIIFAAFLAFLIYMRIDLGLRLIGTFIAENTRSTPDAPKVGQQDSVEGGDGNGQQGS